jgi:hypothetical protein
MTHVRLEYCDDPVFGDGLIRVRLMVGPAMGALRPAHDEQLRLHPVELNGLDRLLSRGALFEAPANTYALVPQPGVVDERDLRIHHPGGLTEHIERRLVVAGRPR